MGALAKPWARLAARWREKRLATVEARHAVWRREFLNVSSLGGPEVGVFAWQHR
jgi:hypothetical protein